MCKRAFIIGVTAIFANIALALSGSGTEADPWRIQSLADFNDFAADANYWDDYTRLETDVNLAGMTYTTAVVAPDPDAANGTFRETSFTGVFDGNDCKVMGLTIDDGGAGNDYLGLFGHIDGGEIRNLGIEDCSISGDHRIGGLLGGTYSNGIVSNCYSTGDIRGSWNIGGLAGSGSASFLNCYSTCDVRGEGDVGGIIGENSSGGPITNCYSTGDVKGIDNVGGLVGLLSYGSLLNCYSIGDVDGVDDVGGLVGHISSASVSNCYSTGDVSGVDDVGGLVGRNSGSISQCYCAGDVNAVGNVGGLVGINGMPEWFTDGSVSNCFWDVDAQRHGVTESIGENYGTVSSVIGLSGEAMATASTFTSAGWDFMGESANGTGETWQMPTDGGYPGLSFFDGEIPFPLPGNGTAGDPYLIGAANELGMVNWYPKDSCFRLTSDIDLSGINWSVAVVPVFHGCFDGNGYRVANLHVSGGWRVGMFGHLGEDGQVKGLGIEGGCVSGEQYVGGLVGENYGGSVSNCYYAGDVNGTDEYLGGLVGYNRGLVSDCCSTGKASGSSYVGGLVGSNSGSLVDCNSIVEVSGYDEVGGLVGRNSGGSISRCRSAGDVHGDYYDVGGLVGENCGGIVSDCYSTSTVDGREDVGGLVGANIDGGSVLKCSSAGDVHGVGFMVDSGVGGLVGANSGTISDCNSRGNVSGDQDVGGLVGTNIYYGSVSYCYSIGDVNGYFGVGGLVGHNEGILFACNSIGDTRGDYNVGGLAGTNEWGHISNSYSIGETSGEGYVGGLVGYNYGSISLCYSASDVNAIGDEVGGLVGSNIFPAHVTSEGIVSKCLWDIDVQTHGVTKSIGDDEGIIIDVVGAETAQMETKETFTSAGWDFLGESANGTSEIWQMPDSGGYPALSLSFGDIPFSLAGSGAGGDPYLVGDANDLGMVRWYPEDCCFKVTCDIDLSGITWPEAVVPKFEGTFDGGGHKLVNMQISGGGWLLGLFGYLGEDCQVTDLGLEGGYVVGVGDGVGSLVGKNDGGSISKCYSTSDVTGRDYVGGLMGLNWGGSVLNCYSTGDINGDWEMGGLVGRNSGGSVSNCYSTSDIDGGRFAGGLVGLNSSSGDVSNCLWNTETQSHGVTDGIYYNVGTVTNVLGLTTAQMQMKSTFTSAGWDFVEVWDLVCEGMNYPRLVWEIAVVDLGCPHGVDSFDYSLFANRWMDTNCGSSADCEGADFDFSGGVDGMDLAIFFGRWLDGTGN